MVEASYHYRNKIAVITGASRGIGRAVAEQLATRGCHVVAIARASEALDQLHHDLNSRGFNISVFECDLSDSNAVTALCNKVVIEFKHVDILVNCAGVGKLGPFTDMTDKEVQAPVKVPLLAAVLLSHRLIPAMINRDESRIINLITPAAYFDLPYMAAYTASRSGLLSFTRALDEEYRHTGLRVRSVCPAWVDTQYLANNQSDGDWYPKVSRFFPTVTAVQAAEYVIKAIEGHRRELKPALLLRLFELSYRWFPRLSVGLFKFMSLYQPGAIHTTRANTQGSQRWTNWEESISLKAAEITFPETVDEVRSIILDKHRYPSPLRAAGSRHTTTHCGVAENGTLMIMRKMDKILAIDIQNGIVTAQAGALYIDVAKALGEKGLQFYVNVEIGNLTMGSAASTGTKDASMFEEKGQVCSYCIGVKMAMADGHIRTIDESEPELLAAVRSSYGLFGVIVETTFKVRPASAMSVHHKNYTLDEFERQLPDLRESGESMMYYLFPFQNTLTVEFRKYHSRQPSAYSHWVWWLRNLFWKTCAPRWGYLATRYVRHKAVRYWLIDNFYRLVSSLTCRFLKSETTFATDQIIRYPEHKNASKYTFSIWAFDEKNIMHVMREYYQFCQQYYIETGFRCDMLNVGYRINADRNPIFSYSYDGTVMTLDPVTTGAPGWDDFLNAYNEFCSKHNGVPLFNQSKWLTRRQVRKAFGDRINLFWKLRTRLDPENRFLNQYFRELFETTALNSDGEIQSPTESN